MLCDDLKNQQKNQKFLTNINLNKKNYMMIDSIGQKDEDLLNIYGYIDSLLLIQSTICYIWVKRFYTSFNEFDFFLDSTETPKFMKPDLLLPC